MDLKLTGKTVLITGASMGIGEHLADVFASEGANLHLTARSTTKLKEIQTRMQNDHHVKVTCHPADLTQSGACEALSQSVGDIDILVNNAGITRDGLFVRMSDDNWNDVMNVNLTAVFHLTRELTHPMMRRRNGRIINITSVVGVTGNPGQVNYCASKAGLIGFSKSLAQEVAPRGITVNCVAPGFIKSAMTDKLNDKQKEGILGAVPMKKMGEGSDIASAVTYLASDEAGYVTGQTLHVNGGMAMI